MLSTLTSKVSGCRNKHKCESPLVGGVHCAIEFSPFTWLPLAMRTNVHCTRTVCERNWQFASHCTLSKLGLKVLDTVLRFSFVFLPYLALLCFFFSQPFWAFTNNYFTLEFMLLCHFGRIALSESKFVYLLGSVKHWSL